MLLQKRKLVSEFNRILAVISELGMWNAERDESQGHSGDVHMCISVLAEPLQSRFRTPDTSASDIDPTLVLKKDLFHRYLPGHLVLEPFSG